MYNTSQGVRVLAGSEKRLFCASLGMMVDLLSDNDFDFGIGVFDRLERNQKIASLHFMARALLTQGVAPPRLTAAVEGAVATVYQHARDRVFQEIEEQRSPCDMESSPFYPEEPRHQGVAWHSG